MRYRAAKQNKKPASMTLAGFVLLRSRYNTSALPPPCALAMASRTIRMSVAKLPAWQPDNGLLPSIWPKASLHAANNSGAVAISRAFPAGVCCC